MAKPKLLTNKEWNKYFEGKKWHQKRGFPKHRTFEKDDILYGYRFSFPPYKNIKIDLPENISITEAFSLFTNEIHSSVQKMQELFNFPRYPYHPMIIDNSRIFSTSEGNRVGCGKKFIERLVKQKGSNVFEKEQLSIQSQYFHEMIHQYTHTLEILPLLAEFLYNPEKNEYRNKVFKNISRKMSELRTDEHDIYQTGWSIDGRILLWEYKQLYPKFQIPESREDQEKLLTALPDLYSNLSKEQRDEILVKYIKENSDETYELMEETKRISHDYANRLDLEF